MPKRTGRPWRRLRQQVIRRDGGICHLCGLPGADSADHLEPDSAGGPAAMANLAAVHHDVWPRCNRIRGARSITEARASIATVIAGAEASAAGWSW